MGRRRRVGSRKLLGPSTMPAINWATVERSGSRHYQWARARSSIGCSSRTATRPNSAPTSSARRRVLSWRLAMASHVKRSANSLSTRLRNWCGPPGPCHVGRVGEGEPIAVVTTLVGNLRPGLVRNGGRPQGRLGRHPLLRLGMPTEISNSGLLTLILMVESSIPSPIAFGGGLLAHWFATGDFRGAEGDRGASRPALERVHGLPRRLDADSGADRHGCGSHL